MERLDDTMHPVDSPPSSKVVKDCLNCKKEFLVRRDRIERSKYCSKQCKHLAMYDQIEIPCQECCKVFSVPKCRERLKYCSRVCYGRAQHVNGGYMTCDGCLGPRDRGSRSGLCKSCLHVRNVKKAGGSLTCLTCGTKNSKRYTQTKYCSMKCVPPRVPEWSLRYATDDGHLVRSRKEVVVDNWLFVHGILHEYEPRSPAGFADWKVGDTFIEYWGVIGSPEYTKRMNEKISIYTATKTPLISIYPEDIERLDEVLGCLLVKVISEVKR